MTIQQTGRWQEMQQRTAAPTRTHALEDLRQKMHTYVIQELGPILYDQRVSEADLRKQVEEQLHRALSQERLAIGAAGSPGAGAVGVRRRPRLRAHRPAAARPRHQRGDGERPGARVHREGGQDRPDRRTVRRRRTPPQDHRQDREPGRSPRRRSDADGGRTTAGWLPSQRGRAPARDRRSVPHDPAVRHRSVHGRRSRGDGHAELADDALHGRLRARPAERRGERWYRNREDDAPERAVGLHPERRADHHDRGLEGAPAPAATRAVTRGPSPEHRRQGRDPHP